MLHLLGEWFYAGHRSSRFGVWLLGTLVVLGLIGGLWLQPRLKHLHAVKYAPNTSQLQKDQAGRDFGLLHGLSQMANLFLTAGVLLYFWRTVHAPSTTRPGKFPRPPG